MKPSAHQAAPASVDGFAARAPAHALRVDLGRRHALCLVHPWLLKEGTADRAGSAMRFR